MATLFGNEQASSVKRSLVYQATHTGGGAILPYMNRSFISFTFGGKRIEEFNLIATVSGSRMDRDGYAPFEDTVSTYDNIDGQYYWGTHYQANLMEFTLSTDGIDQKMLDEFLHWFQAGVTRELVLAEHPNRAILARVESPPRLSLLPFEEPVTITISSLQYSTITTLYKGEITLSLIMDEPHWYSIKNLLGEEVVRDQRHYYEDLWPDINNPGLYISIFNSKDALKILYEDGIPLGSMIAENMLLGNGAYARVEGDAEGSIWSLSEEDSAFIPFDDPGFPGTGYGAMIVADDATSNFTAFISGAMVDIGGEGKINSLSSASEAYFFYAGTAPAPTVISFTLTPEFNNGSNYYIITPRSKFSGGTEYNTITIASTNTLELRFTTPNIFTSYNKTIKIFLDMVNLSAPNPVYSWEDIRKKIRDNIRHPAVRTWANKIIECITNNFSATANADLNEITLYMSYLFKDVLGNPKPVSFIFNSLTGEAKGIFQYRKVSDQAAPTNIHSNNDWLNFGASNLVTVTEDVGDMLKSNYIILRDRNYPTADGKIYQRVNEEGKKQYSHMFKHDCNVPLNDVSILYKNMYL